MYCRNVPLWASPDEIRIVAHALSGRRFDHDFLQWFLPHYTRGRGIPDMSLLVYSAAEFFIDLFCEVWSSQGQTNKYLRKDESTRLVNPLGLSQMSKKGTLNAHVHVTEYKLISSLLHSQSRFHLSAQTPK